MPEDKELEQKDGETKEQYIVRLKERLHKLFEQHEKENEGQPCFPSDIEDPLERARWEEWQFAQWNARHAVMKALRDVAGNEHDEIDTEEFSTIEYYGLELRQRWLTDVGKGFLAAIIVGLKEWGNRWDTNGTGAQEKGLAFADVVHDGKKFSDFYYVRKTVDIGFRDLQCADLRAVRIEQANLAGAALGHANLQDARLSQSNLKKAVLVKADLKKSDLCGAQICEANLEGADLSNAILDGVDLVRANLSSVKLSHAVLVSADLRCANMLFANLEWAQCCGENEEIDAANFQGARLVAANLRHANLGRVNLDQASLPLAQLQGATLRGASLRGAQLTGAEVAGPVLRIRHSTQKVVEEAIDDNSANFASVKYSREWHGPLWAAIFWSLLTYLLSPITSAAQFVWRGIVEWKWQWEWIPRAKFAWKRGHTLRNNVLNWLEKENDHKTAKLIEGVVNCGRWAKEGRPTTFLGIDTSRLNASKNPGLKRDIEDEQFIADFKEKNSFIYKLWARSSDCGRSIPLWTFWCAVAILFFAGLYSVFPLVSTDGNPPAKQQDFWSSLYGSVLTFSTFGFESIKPVWWLGKLIAAAEVICGYVFFGGLVALFTETLTRRA